MTIANPNTFKVIHIFIFFCEKIVFMIRIRTYIKRILVIIGRINFTMKRLSDKMIKQFYDCFCILFIADDKKLLCGSSFAHDTFDATWCRIRDFEMDFRRSFLLSRNPPRDYSTNQWMFFNLCNQVVEFRQDMMFGFGFEELHEEKRKN